MCLLSGEREVMSWGGDSAVAFADEPWVIGDFLVLEEDQDPIPVLMEFDLFADETLWDGVSIGLQMGIAFHIHYPV